MRKKSFYFKIAFLLIVISSSVFISGCSKNEKNIEDFLNYFYTFDKKSNSGFFEEFNSADGVEELVALLDEKYEYMDNLCTQRCIDPLRNNREPISLWKFLNDKGMDMKVSNIKLEQTNDSIYDFLLTVVISRDDEIINSIEQKGQIILDQNNKIDNVYFQNLKKIFEVK